MSPTHITALDPARITSLCQQHGIREFAIFGSAARDELVPESDIDVMIDFLPKTKPSLLDLVTIQEELQEMFGRPVDLLTRDGLKHMRNQLRRERITAGLKVIYVA